MVVILVVGCGKTDDKAPPAEATRSTPAAPVKVEAPPRSTCELAAERAAAILLEANGTARELEVGETRVAMLEECYLAAWTAEVTGCILKASSLPSLNECEELLVPTRAAEVRIDYAGIVEEAGEDLEVRAVGSNNTVLRFASEGCDEIKLRSLVTVFADVLRPRGFTGAECYRPAARRVVATSDL